MGLDGGQNLVGMLATNLNVNIELFSNVFDLDIFPDMILRSDDHATKERVVVLLLGYPTFIQPIDIPQFAADHGYIYVDMDDVLNKANNMHTSDVIDERDLVRMLEEEIDDHVATRTKLDSHAGGLLGQQRRKNQPSNVLPILVCGLPRSEAEARALCESNIRVDCVLEIVPAATDADLEFDDYHEDYLDAVEHLRVAYRLDPADGPLHTRGPADSLLNASRQALERSDTEGSRAGRPVYWRRVVVEDVSGPGSLRTAHSLLGDEVREVVNKFSSEFNIEKLLLLMVNRH